MRLRRTAEKDRPQVTLGVLKSISCSLLGVSSHPSSIVNPVDLPGLSAVRRECLFKVRRHWVDILPYKSNVDGTTFKHIRGVKLSAVAIKLPNLRRIEHARLGARTVNAPLPRSRVVQAHSNDLNMTMTGCAVHVHFAQVTVSVHEWRRDHCAFKLFPILAAG